MVFQTVLFNGTNNFGEVSGSTQVFFSNKYLLGANYILTAILAIWGYFREQNRMNLCVHWV